MWDLPGSGMELVSLALQRGFLTMRPPGKPHIIICFDGSLCQPKPGPHPGMHVLKEVDLIINVFLLYIIVRA